MRWGSKTGGHAGQVQGQRVEAVAWAWRSSTVTSAPSVIAPTNSVNTAMMHAAVSVREPEPTDVANCTKERGGGRSAR